MQSQSSTSKLFYVSLKIIHKYTSRPGWGWNLIRAHTSEEACAIATKTAETFEYFWHIVDVEATEQN